MDKPGVLVTRAHDGFSDLLADNGFRVFNLEVTRTIELEDLAAAKSLISRSAAYDGCIITSPIAARIFIRESKVMDVPRAAKIYVLGDRSREIFVSEGINVESRSEANTADELVSAFGLEEFADKSLLFIRGERSMRTIPDMLGGSCVMDEAVVYRTECQVLSSETTDNIRNMVRNSEIQWITFFAPSAAECFFTAFDSKELGGLRMAAIGRSTARAISKAGLKVDYVSERAKAADFAAGLVRQIKTH